MIYLSIIDGKLVAKFDGPRGGKLSCKREVADMGSLIALLNTLGDSHVMCSSSLDFPDEYTKDEAVIALCDKIRGNA